MQRFLWEIAGHPGPCNRRGKGFEARKAREEPSGTGESCNETISTGAFLRGENKERNTSLLPRLFC